MTDLQEILVLIRKIDTRLKTMQCGIVWEKLNNSYRQDKQLYWDFYFTGFIVLCELCILIIGVLYLISTKEKLPPIAIIGITGIAFALLNSILDASRKLQLFYKAKDKHNTNSKYYENIGRDLTCIKEEINAQTNEIIGNFDIAYSKDALDEIYEDILEKMRRSVDERSSKTDTNADESTTSTELRTMKLSP